jgi:hypothetical protein
LLAGLALGATPALADSLGSPTRISETGETADIYAPSVAYGEKAGQYLSVWADDSGETAITGRLVNADGAPAGEQVEISAPSDPCEGEALAAAEVIRECGEWVAEPVVAYNATADEFLVVWRQSLGFPQVQAAAEGECGWPSAIVARRVSAAGVPLGDPFAVTAGFPCAGEPDVSWSATANRYLVAWSDRARLSVRAQLLDAGGTPLLDEELDVSLPGEEQEYADEAPAIAYDGVANRWLVVWRDGDGGIAGQLVDADGARVGESELVAEHYEAADPDVAFSATSKQFLLAYSQWVGMSSLAAAAAEPDRVVYGQRLDQAGAPIGTTAFLLSATRLFQAAEPTVAWDPRGDRYLVVYAGGAQASPPPFDVFGQLVAADGTLVGTEGFPVTDRAADRNPRGLAYNTARCEFLTTWEGAEDGKREIYARRVAGTACPQPEQPQPVTPTTAPPGVTPAGAPPAATPDTRRPRLAVKGARTFGGSCNSATSVRLRVRARDASAVRVTVFVDGKRVRSTSRARFNVVLSARSLDTGRHTVRVVARDAAGNRSVRRVTVRRCQERVVLPRFAG